MDRKIPLKEIKQARWKRFGIIGGCAILAVTLIIVGGSYFGTSSLKSSTLHFSDCDRGDIEASINATGRIIPAYQEIVNSPISSKILEVCHRPGDSIAVGDTLLKLDLHAARIATEKQQDHLRMRHLELSQQIAGDRTALARMEMQIKVSEMRVKRLRAELENERYLDSIGSGTTDRVRQAEFALRSEELDLEQQRLQLENERAARKAALDVRKLDIEIMTKETEIALRTLSDAGIRAPKSGTLTEIVSNIGAQVGSGQQVAVIADLDHCKVDAEASDAYNDAIVSGQKVRIRVRGKAFMGYISEVSPTSSSGMIRFKVSLENDSASDLRVGIRPDVYVYNGLKTDVVRIANGPYYDKAGKYTLFVRNGNVLERRDVVLGVANMDSVEVISGINPGDVVVTDNLSRYSQEKILKLK